MVTLTEFAVLGIIEAFVALVLGAGALLFYNNRLHKRGKSLATQLKQLKETTRFLLDKVNSFDVDTFEAETNSRINTTKRHISTLIEPEELTFERGQPQDTKAALLRYLLLKIELEVSNEPDEDLRWQELQAKLGDVVASLETSMAPVETAEAKDTAPSVASPDEPGNDMEALKDKWLYLCDAAFNAVQTRTFEAEDDLIEILQSIHRDLELGELKVPDRAEDKTVSIDRVTDLKVSSDSQKEMIAELLAQRNAATAEVSIKIEELEKMQRFLTESETCINLLEAELHTARTQGTGEDEVDEDKAQMQSMVEKFSKENKELQGCIKTLEQENEQLRQAGGE